MQPDDLYFSRSGPHVPKGAESDVGNLSLNERIQFLTESTIDPGVAENVNSILDRLSNSSEPMLELQAVLEPIRCTVSGDKRILLMNSFLKTLGQPHALASYLDMLRASAKRYGTSDQLLCKEVSQDARLHSAYGWCGSTLILESCQGETANTLSPVPGLAEMIGNTTSEWGLAVHVWQPNERAAAFSVGESCHPDVILEPPHSHPFDFLSYVVKGEMHQSLYMQTNSLSSQDCEPSNQRYENTALEHVDGIWPPHKFQESVKLDVLEQRVRLEAGHTYFMSCGDIHDVEIDKVAAQNKPTITLFLSSEYITKPHAYIAKSMADFHSTHCEIKDIFTKMNEESWHEKLRKISAYLRGDSATLELNEVVRHPESYAFFHGD